MIGDADRWIGTSFITLAVVCASYAVFAAGIFFGPAVAARAFRTTVIGGATVGALIVVLFGIEVLSSNVLGLESPFLPVLGFVVIAALYGPLASRIRRRAIGGASRAVARDRLLRVLGERELAVSPAAAGVKPALAHVMRVLDVTGLTVTGPDGSLIASEGSPPASGAVVSMPLRDGGELVGEMRVGETASGGPMDTRDQRLLDLSASYIASALRTGRREDEQATRARRTSRRRAPPSMRTRRPSTAPWSGDSDAAPGLRVFALGPLRMERGGTRIEHWGGDKAGSRQAQGLFAFLYDRGERGVAKDEVLELIWPDVDLERADLAFHRTMAGLRATLDPDKRRGGRCGDPVRATIATGSTGRSSPGRTWTRSSRRSTRPPRRTGPPGRDSSRRRAGSAGASTSTTAPTTATASSSRSGGSCSGAGSSTSSSRWGRPTRRARDRMSAAAAFREAITRSPDGCPPAVAGLARLGL